MGWRVTLTDSAVADLEAAVMFLAAYSPAVAERIGLELVEVAARCLSREFRRPAGYTGKQRGTKNRIEAD